MNAKKWIKICFIIIIIIIPIVGGFNYLVDPYDKNHNYNYDFVNKIKIIQDERQLKFKYLKDNYKYKAIILGNSKGTYIDPSIIENYTNLETYNASFSSGTMNEFLQYTKWLVKYRNIKQLYVVFEYYALTSFKSNGTMPFELREVNNDTNNYFSILELRDSIKTILHNINSKEASEEEKLYMSKGMRYNKKYFERKQSIEKQLEHIEHLKSEKIVWHGKSISNERINNLKEIVSLCKDNNIELFLLQTPSSYRKLNYNDRKEYEKLLSLIKQIAMEIHPVYFFNNFNYVNNNLKYFLDNSHFNYDVNKLIFKKIFLDDGIGIKVEANNIYLLDSLKVSTK